MANVDVVQYDHRFRIQRGNHPYHAHQPNPAVAV